VNPDPRNYLEHAWLDYLRDALAAGLLRKLKELPNSADRVANALTKWYEGEAQCYQTNQRLVRYLPEFGSSADREGHVERFLASTRKIIRDWIGDAPDDLAIGRFGPGATYSNRGGKTTVPDKMSGDPSLTRDAVWYLPQWLSTQWGASVAHHRGEFAFVPGNRFTTVPKTSKTDRSIAMEPSINVFFQLALGKQLRQRLKNRTGWDLSKAQEIHGQVARESSLTREFATLDLSNASDTVAFNLVKLLLPHRWFEALSSLRSPKTLIEGRWVMLEKFSSMGNGFTFELETILFGAIACAVARKSDCKAGRIGRDVFCYGDDIICKDELALPVKSVLEFLGFSLNKEKSYFGGVPFRESCGEDYFAGNSVRPFFLKDIPDEPQDYIAFANGIKASMDQLPLAAAWSKSAWFSILDCLPTRVRQCRGPQGLGDIVIHDDSDFWTTRWRNGIRYLRCFRPYRYRVVPYAVFSSEVVLACATYGCGLYRGGVIPRDGVRGYKIGWVTYS